MKPLTARELTCLGWASIGKTSWEMGVILGLTERTVNFHIHNACKKLHVHSRQAAITAALQAGLLPVPNVAPPPALSGTRLPANRETRLNEPSLCLQPARAAIPKQ
ncbi:helix-turn-helix domain-containing protein [Eoetvoesiella caeni]|uniref:DNA-binding CsgD family transcriptional regulator n=1 Tax=Eoetvoesiella caeni TaxID=645616 RepID=A0A366HFC9_9BURK|nr:helix-turn-helix domain-containing protein [Eoetvoesiella caeni]MCI2808949.1 helix-turn-helix domain-containing protein [Eoetvoesiella caeni]NYT55550.1 helix-turn-helix domain-containing protein [Eoetvoesiella caeni]RBP40105.1 DNA-binding CsgD family transcriptional regulator [Eoetvoesiella caeni]